MRSLVRKTSLVFGKLFCRAVFLCAIVFAVSGTPRFSNTSAQILAVLGDNHEDLASLLKAVEQAKARGATDFLITGDAIKGDHKDLRRMFSLWPSMVTIREKLSEHRRELEFVLQQVALKAGVSRDKIHFLKGNYEDVGYFHDEPLLVRRASDDIIERYVTPVMLIHSDRPVHDDELGIIEIHALEGDTIFRLAVSHKPLIQLPYDAYHVEESLVQSPWQQRNLRNMFRRSARLREPDTRTTMRYEAKGKVKFPADVMAYLFGHTHIAGGFYHPIEVNGEVLQLPSLNSGSLNPTKKPSDQFESFMLVNLPESYATWHDIARNGMQVKSWKFGQGSEPISSESHEEACMRVMRDTAAALSLTARLRNRFSNLIPVVRSTHPVIVR